MLLRGWWRNLHSTLLAKYWHCVALDRSCNTVNLMQDKDVYSLSSFIQLRQINVQKEKTIFCTLIIFTFNLLE